MDWELDRLHARTPKRNFPQVHSHPFAEQLNLLSFLVQKPYLPDIEVDVVGEEHTLLSGPSAVLLDLALFFGMAFFWNNALRACYRVIR